MDKENIKQNKRSALFTLVLAVVALLVLVTTSFAWFYAPNKTDIERVKIGVKSPLDLQISTTGDYGGSAFIDIDPNLRLVPLGGDGMTFFKPTAYDPVGRVIRRVDVAEGQIPDYYVHDPKATEFEEVSEEDLFNKVLVMDYSLSSSEPVNICLSKGTKLLPVGEFNLTASLCGAIRVAFIRKTVDGNESRLVWIPYPTYEVVATATEYSLSARGIPEEEYVFMHGDTLEDENVTKISTLGADGKPRDSGLVEIDGTQYYWGDIKNDIVFDTLDSNIQYYRVIMWLDGNDRECSDTIATYYDEENVLRTGAFSLTIIFSATEITK